MKYTVTYAQSTSNVHTSSYDSFEECYNVVPEGCCFSIYKNRSDNSKLPPVIGRKPITLISEKNESEKCYIYNNK